MPSGSVIRKNQYYDSVFLMSVNARILKVAGVQQTAVLMASPTNKHLLLDIGIQSAEIDAAQPNDLVVAVIADTEKVVDDILGNLDDWLNAVQQTQPVSQLHSLEDGLAVLPSANLAVISIPGEYAAREARRALDAGLNVFLFSDNVSIEDELELKHLAKQKSLLVMGPDCGTSLIGGKGIGFANAVRKGSIGVIGASGTGLQEFTSQVHNFGSGISHAIGTGSRDLSKRIGGLSTLAAIDSLERDPSTHVVAIISKPPAEKTLKKILDRIDGCKKPVVGCFIGIDSGILEGRKNLMPAGTIDEAARRAIELSGGQLPGDPGISEADLSSLAIERKSWSSSQKYLRGILAGGTFCFQSQHILRKAGIPVYSNTPLELKNKLAHPDKSFEHSLVDMGDEFYMVGKPHPMIDATMRRQRLLAESQDPQMAVLYLDFILGYNASIDPVGELIESICEVKRIYKKRGGSLTVVTSVCGTDGDPQDMGSQKRMLRDAGALVFDTNALATEACCWLLSGEKRL